MSHEAEKLPPRPPIPFTPERKELYLEELRRTGFVALSAEVVGVSEWTINNHRKQDEEFNRRCKEALRTHAEDHYLRALHERGVVGYLEPIIGGKDRDEVVAHKRVFSDACLMALAKSRLHELRDPDGATSGSGSGFSGGVLIVPAAPTSMDDWERDFGEAAKGQTGRDAHE